MSGGFLVKKYRNPNPLKHNGFLGATGHAPTRQPISNAEQSQKAVTAYLKSEQLMPFGFAELNRCAIMMILIPGQHIHISVNKSDPIAARC